MTVGFVYKEGKQLEDRRSVGASSCNSEDGTDPRVQSLMFMMMMMMMMMIRILLFDSVSYAFLLCLCTLIIMYALFSSCQLALFGYPD